MAILSFNNYHHRYGYPDPDYLRRVKEDLEAEGIRWSWVGGMGSRHHQKYKDVK